VAPDGRCMGGEEWVLAARRSCCRPHRQVALFFILTTLLMLGFFIAMWCVGWATGRYNGVDTSFSAMLEQEPTMKIIYIVWLVLYAAIIFFTIFLVFSYDTLAHGKHLIEHDLVLESVTWFAILYGLFSAVEVVALAFVPIYDLSAQPQSHAIAAGMGFASAVFSMFCLFIRRCIIILHHHPIEQDQKLEDSLIGLGGEEELQAYYRRARILLAFNFLWVALALSLLITFAVRSIGLVEFFVCLCVVCDRFWQIWDFGQDPQSLRRHPRLEALLTLLR
jgi:hypothetical protein